MASKFSSPLSIAMVEEIVANLGGEATLDEVVSKVKLVLSPEIQCLYPTERKLRDRIIVILSQQIKIFQRVGPSGSAIYRFIRHHDFWERKVTDERTSTSETTAEFLVPIPSGNLLV